MLRLAPAAAMLVLLVPVAAGLAGTVLPAFGILPVLGGVRAALMPWRELFATPGIVRSLVATLVSGLGASLIAALLAIFLAASLRRGRRLIIVETALAPLLAQPHAALAIGLAFLIAPSGWIARLLSPWLTGWHIPPDLATVQDGFGIALMAGLVVKEAPYLLLMTLVAGGQAEVARRLESTAALGYGPVRGFLLAVLPALWPQLRLPMFAVIAYSLSVVDMAIVLGPTDPPTLAVLVVRWFQDPDLTRWFPAAAGASFLVLLTVLAMLGMLGLERGVAYVGRLMIWRGRRGGAGRVSSAVLLSVGAVVASISLLACAALGLWSVAISWPFPAALPIHFSLETWRAARMELIGPAFTTLWLGFAATALALVLAVACLEHEAQHGIRPGRWTLWVLYAPLVLPQIGFLFGMEVAILRIGISGWAALVLAHLVFVLPYVFLTLADPWRALDPRYRRIGLSLGVTRFRVLVRIVLPLMARPLLTAAAVGFAVSAGLYLPTLFVGGGRFATLTTVAVTLASGGDRRVAGATALAQTALPLAFFAIATAVPAMRARRRAGLAIAR